MSEKFSCPRIRNGLSFAYDGKYSICCMIDENVYRTDKDNPGSGMHTSDHSLDAFLNSEWRQALIKHEDEGTWPPQCQGCLDVELSGLQSYRQELGNRTNRHLHVQTGNLCDSDCIMCGPQWSTKTRSRLKMHPDQDKNFLGKSEFPVRSLWKEPKSVSNLSDAARWTDHIHFGGGEPLMNPRIWNFLESIVRNDLSISFVTNLNTIPTERAFDILRGFKNVGFNVSIDATGNLYNWIRHGLSYDTLIRNLAVIKSKKFNIGINCEVQAHNISNMPEHYKTFTKFNLEPDYYFVQMPRILQARNAPKHIIEKALSNLPADANTQLLLGLKTALSQHDPKMHDLLIKHTSYLNNHRHYSFDCETWMIK